MKKGLLLFLVAESASTLGFAQADKRSLSTVEWGIRSGIALGSLHYRQAQQHFGGAGTGSVYWLQGSVYRPGVTVEGYFAPILSRRVSILLTESILWTTRGLRLTELTYGPHPDAIRSGKLVRRTLYVATGFGAKCYPLLTRTLFLEASPLLLIGLREQYTFLEESSRSTGETSYGLRVGLGYTFAVGQHQATLQFHHMRGLHLQTVPSTHQLISMFTLGYAWRQGKYT